ncbi:helix-turn-helix transcriptional regulator [Streptomyces sp. NBC_00091]|uniref:helix-turn-helix domain-containing protein n=1 Tax=Streptomyces sp. NBC_00091 TaxID=2975648 RepID=UPI00225420CD|nr:helix-turn-helix transcriptional regulator [Streptomyces sp. NBC_00091]MCX5376645.1 helix-turn-helix transcriptional regulator [Streptomyces sp. NBC_00091]
MDDQGVEPEEVEDPNGALRSFAEVAKAFRKRSRLTQEEMAERIGYSVQYVGSVEQARRYPSERFVDRMESELDCFGAVKGAARHLTKPRRVASWFKKWALLEPAAVSLYTYECRMVPGLLQREEYARGIFAERVPPLEDARIEAQVAGRLERQHILRDLPNSSFSFIIEQSVFDRHFGGREVMRDQVDHILGLIRLRNVTVQIMPKEQAEHAGHDGPIRLLETPDHQWLAYSEGQRTGVLISDPSEVSILHQRYAKLRSQALNPADSLGLLEQTRGTL